VATPGEADVVLVPGFMQGAASWAGALERMGRRYRALALEHRTHELEGRLAEIEAAAAEGAAVVGYSLGGRLALHAAVRAADRPRRFGALVTLGTSAGIEDLDERERRRVADLELAAWIERRPIEEVVERWERVPALAGQPPELVGAQRRDRLAQEPARLAALLRSAGQGALAPVWDRLPSLPVPVLALAGSRDTQYVAAAERIAALVPRGRAGVLPGAGHAAHLERPAAFVGALLEFLDEHLGERRLVDLDA
jgi:2-succinyl-6-hydroxy-2,4-cyclohexadiene-1-carboxylate synthase